MIDTHCTGSREADGMNPVNSGYIYPKPPDRVYNVLIGYITESTHLINIWICHFGS